MAFELRVEGGEGISLGDIWGDVANKATMVRKTFLMSLHLW